MDESREIQIERYILKTMTDDEALEFESKLASDPELRHEYEATLAARQLITEAGRQEIKASLESLEKEITQEIPTGRVMPLWVKRALPIAAMLVIFFSIYLFTESQRTQTAQAVFSDYFETYQAPGAVRNDNGEELTQWNSAIELYKSRKFEEVLSALDTIEEDVPEYLVSFYEGVSAMSVDPPNNDRALSAFNSVMTSDNDYVQQSRWYKGLTLLQKGSIEEARAVFETIVAQKGYRHQEASKILKKEITN